MVDIRAYCAECKRMVSDDIVKTGDGTSINKHEHEVIILLERGSVPPGAIITSVMELTPESYLSQASQLDAELIVGRITSKYSIPFGEKIITDIVGMVLKSIREVAIEAEQKDRLRANIRQKLEKVKDLKQQKQVLDAKKKERKKAPDMPLV